MIVIVGFKGTSNENITLISVLLNVSHIIEVLSFDSILSVWSEEITFVLEFSLSIIIMLTLVFFIYDFLGVKSRLSIGALMIDIKLFIDEFFLLSIDCGMKILIYD
jgi:hypothetical protein